MNHQTKKHKKTKQNKTKQNKKKWAVSSGSRLIRRLDSRTSFDQPRTKGIVSSYYFLPSKLDITC